MRRMTRYLFPSFQRLTTVSSTAKTRATAYLDGIRGVAAFLVVLHHYTCQFTPSLLNGFGSSSEDLFFFQLPIVSALYNGAFMVNIFYVLSGCVLSARCLRLAREGKQEKFTAALVSSVFRRWIRLFLPVMVTMAIAAVISHTELWDRGSSHPSVAVENSTYYTGPQAPPAPPCSNLLRREDKQMENKDTILIGNVKVEDTRKDRPRWVSAWKMQPRMDTISEQFWHWEETVEIVVDPFNMGGHEGEITQLLSPYNAGDVMWTIPLEWTGSMLVFMLTLMTAWIARSYVRLGIFGILAIWCLRTLRWYQARFIMGMIIAELTLNLEDQRQLPVSLDTMEKSRTGSDRSKRAGSLQTAGWICVFVVALFFGSLPHNDPAQAWGFRALLSYNPTWYGGGASHIFLAIASFLLMLSVTNCPSLQKVFNSRLAHYLGKISFALYLIHVMILWTIGTRIFDIFINAIGKEGAPYLFAVACGTGIMLPLTIWLSDLYTIYVDEKCVSLAKWVGDAFLVSFY